MPERARAFISDETSFDLSPDVMLRKVCMDFPWLVSAAIMEKAGLPKEERNAMPFPHIKMMGGEESIPIHVFWHGAQLSRMALLSLRSMARFGETVLHSFKDPPVNLPEGVTWSNAEWVLGRDFMATCPEVRYFSDLFRYALLATHEGPIIWSDLDVIWLKRPGRVEGGRFFAATQWTGWDRGHAVVGNVLYSSPLESGAPWGQLLSASQALLDSDKTEFGTIGPLLLTKLMEPSDVVRPQEFNPISPNEVDLLWRRSQRSQAEVLCETSTGVHLWSCVWEQRGLTLDDVHPSSYLGRLMKELES